MRTKNLTKLSCHMVTAYANTARHVIHAYQSGGERVIGLLQQRWQGALRKSRSQLASDVAKNASNAQHVLHRYSVKGLTLTSDGAQHMVKRVADLADAGILAISSNATRFEDKTGVHALSTLARAALPGATLLGTLATQIEHKTANLASRIAGDVVAQKPRRRARVTPRQAAAPAAS